MVVMPPRASQVGMASSVTGSPSGSASFVVNSVIHGYHVYKDIWPSPVVEEQLQCEREVGNSHDPMSVAVKKRSLGTSPGKYLPCVQFLLEEVDLSFALWMVRGAIQPTYPKVDWSCLVN